MGSKIKQIATMTPQHIAEKIPRPREWRLNQIGAALSGALLNNQKLETDLEHQDAKTRAKVVRKGMGLGRKGKKSGNGAPPEREEEEKSGKRFFPGPATLPSDWRDKKPEGSGCVRPD